MPNGEYDIYGENWGVGIPAPSFDFDVITALVEATKHIEMDQLYLGWDGEEIPVWDLVASICRQHGFFFGSNAEGRITFAQLRMADIRDAGNTVVYPIPTDLERRPSEGEGINQMRGTIGATPWSEGVPYAVGVLGQRGNNEPSTTLRAAAFNGGQSSNIDMPTRSPRRAVEDLISMAGSRAFGAPKMTVKVLDTGFAHGDFVRLGDPGLANDYFYDLSDNPITPTDTPRWYGMVIGKSPDPSPGTIRLTLLLTNWYSERWARLRAPSAQCSSANTTTSYPVVPTFGVDAGTEFAVGMPVELWRPDGVRRSGTSGAHDIQTIASVAAGEIVLDTAFTTAAQAGDIIRLAPLNDSISGTAEDGSDLPHAGYVAYVFAGAGRTLGPNDLDPHIYAVGAA